MLMSSSPSRRVRRPPRWILVILWPCDWIVGCRLKASTGLICAGWQFNTLNRSSRSTLQQWPRLLVEMCLVFHCSLLTSERISCIAKVDRMSAKSFKFLIPWSSHVFRLSTCIILNSLATLPKTDSQINLQTLCTCKQLVWKEPNLQDLSCFQHQKHQRSLSDQLPKRAIIDPSWPVEEVIFLGMPLFAFTFLR